MMGATGVQIDQNINAIADVTAIPLPEVLGVPLKVCWYLASSDIVITLLAHYHSAKISHY